MNTQFNKMTIKKNKGLVGMDINVNYYSPLKTEFDFPKKGNEQITK